MLENWLKLNISSCKRLESIEFHLTLSLELPPRGAFCTAITGMLLQAAPTLRRVTIELARLSDASVLGRKNLQLGRIDKILTETRFPVLEQVVIHIDPWTDSSENWYQQCTNSVHKHLSELTARGKLSVTFQYMYVS